MPYAIAALPSRMILMKLRKPGKRPFAAPPARATPTGGRYRYSPPPPPHLSPLYKAAQADTPGRAAHTTNRDPTTYSTTPRNSGDPTNSGKPRPNANEHEETRKAHNSLFTSARGTPGRCTYTSRITSWGKPPPPAPTLADACPADADARATPFPPLISTFCF